MSAYLELKHSNIFTQEYYEERLRPDSLLLKNYPDDPKFENGKFWSVVKFNDHLITNGYKMKWHQVERMYYID